MLSGVVLVLVPTGLISLPSLYVIGVALISSTTFICEIFLLYTALSEGHASDIMPIVGGVAALTTALCAYQWLYTDLPRAVVPGFVLMVIGMFLISRFRLTWRQRRLVVLAGIFFGVTAFLTKLVFLEANFLNGFFWTRMTYVLGALLLLTVSANRRAIFHGYSGSSSGTKWLVLCGKMLSGTAGVLVLLAISLGSVSIVQALTGLQFVFLLLIAFLFRGRFPGVLGGELHPAGFRHKLVGIISIMFGLALLFLF